jgi:hypothetical protein
MTEKFPSPPGAHLTDEQIAAAWDAWPHTAITSRRRAVEFVRSLPAPSPVPAPAVPERFVNGCNYGGRNCGRSACERECCAPRQEAAAPAEGDGPRPEAVTGIFEQATRQWLATPQPQPKPGAVPRPISDFPALQAEIAAAVDRGELSVGGAQPQPKGVVASQMPLVLKLRVLADQIKRNDGLRDNAAKDHRTLIEAADAIAASQSPAPAPEVPAGYKLLKDTTPSEREWVEDADHENGRYFNTCCECGRSFVGHKRRVVCKHCATQPTQAPAVGAEPADAAVRLDAERWQALQLMWKADVIAGMDENGRPLRMRHAGPWGLTERVDAKRATLADQPPVQGSQT